MLIDNLKDFLALRPFRPFAIHLASGQTIRVDQPERLSISPDRTRIAVFTADNRFHLLEVSQITDLKVS